MKYFVTKNNMKFSSMNVKVSEPQHLVVSSNNENMLIFNTTSQSNANYPRLSGLQIALIYENNSFVTFKILL